MWVFDKYVFIWLLLYSHQSSKTDLNSWCPELKIHVNIKQPDTTFICVLHIFIIHLTHQKRACDVTADLLSDKIMSYLTQINLICPEVHETTSFHTTHWRIKVVNFALQFIGNNRNVWDQTAINWEFKTVTDILDIVGENILPWLLKKEVLLSTSLRFLNIMNIYASSCAWSDAMLTTCTMYSSITCRNYFERLVKPQIGVRNKYNQNVLMIIVGKYWYAVLAFNFQIWHESTMDC